MSTIFIGNLPARTSEASLIQAFAPFGEVLSVNIPDRKDFAFLEFANKESVEDAVDNMHLNVLDGATITVKVAKPMQGKERDSRRAIWEDEEWIKLHGVQEAAAAPAEAE